MDLSELRARIDVVNDEILNLFLERMDLVEQIGDYKKAHGLPVRNRQREREILATISAKAGDRDRFAYHLFSTIIKLACARESEQLCGPSRVEAQVKAALDNGSDLVAAVADDMNIVSDSAAQVADIEAVDGIIRVLVK